MKQLNLRALANSENDRQEAWCITCDAKDRCDECDATDFGNKDCDGCDYGTECTNLG